jgi:hypothetical protein
MFPLATKTQKYVYACQSALQPWVNIGLLYNQSPLLGF